MSHESLIKIVRSFNFTKYKFVKVLQFVQKAKIFKFGPGD